MQTLKCELKMVTKRAFHISYYLFSFLLIGLLFSCESRDNHDEYLPDVAKVQAVGKYGFIEDGLIVENGTIKSGDFFGELMLRKGVSSNTLQTILEASKEVFDIRLIRVGNGYEFFYKEEGKSDSIQAAGTLSGTPLYFVYEKDALSHVVFGLGDSVYVNIVEKQIDRVKRYAEVTVKSSLWNDVS